MMNEYNFECVFKLAPSEKPDSYLDALYRAGCDHTLVATGIPGYLGLTFIREAESAQQALKTAIKEVKEAIPHATLERAAPDLLNLSELALLFQFTKQNMRKYARGETANSLGDFPAPVVTGKTSYWHAAEVAQWIKEQKLKDIRDSMIEALLTIWSLNQANAMLSQPDPDMTATFTHFLRSVA